MDETSSTPAPKRRWFRFSLRGLLVVVTVAAISLATGPPLYRSYSEWQSQREFDALRDLIVKTVKPQTSGPYP